MKINNLLYQIKHSFSSFQREEKLLCLALVSTFTPFVLSAVMAVVCVIYLFAHKSLRERMFVARGFKTMMLLLSLIIIVPVVRGFWIGVGTGLLFILLVFFVFFVRAVLTKSVFETTVDLCLLVSVVGTAVGLVQFLLNLDDPFTVQYRTTSFYFNANYYGSMMETAVMLCIYKIMTRPNDKLYYCFLILCSVVGIYLSGSMSALAALCGGVLVSVLLWNRKVGVRLIFVGILLGGFVVFAVPGLFPRIAEFGRTLGLREEIWETTVKGIQDSPWFGHGVLGYMDAYVKYQSFQTTHAHNLYLNLILDFGVVGTILFVSFMFQLMRPIFDAFRYHYDKNLRILVIGQLAVVLLHGMTDVTYLWIQTGMLTMTIFCLPGIMAPKQFETDGPHEK
ncbi:MAG TPA: O-antigen ligase family protein [Firmicutes bacterium]|nr:O-antigen ligase family protein [Bacillota bacterium]